MAAGDPPPNPDYDSASAALKRYAFIGDSSNLVGTSDEDGYYTW